MSEPLTLDNAVSAMFVKPDETPAAAPAEGNSAPAQDDKAAPPAAADETNSAPASADTAAAEGDTNAPSDEGKTTEAAADPGDALPPIEAPSSWTAEEKAEWNSLSRKAQEAVLRREQDNTRELRNLQNRQAEQQKTVEAEVGRLKGIAERAEAIANRDVAQLAKDFPEVKSEADLVSLAQRDPARYSEFQARLGALNGSLQAVEAAKAETAKAAEKSQAALLAQAKDALIEAFPSWKDPEVARREVVELQDYAIKSGATEAAARSSIDPVLYKLAHKAMLYDRAQAAKAQALTREPPRAVKPGAQSADPRSTAKENVRRSQLDKLSKSGSVDDALGLMFVQ